MIPRGRILFVDPYQVHLFTTVKLLEQAGYLCVTVRQSNQAIQSLQASSFDLMIAEIHMPVKEILQLLQAAHQLTPELPVMLYTQDPSLEKTIGDVQLRINSFLIKPVIPDLLVDEVRKSINTSSHSMPSSFTSKTISDSNQENVIRVDQLTQALEETIVVIESTRKSFKSRELATLRKKLQRLLSREK